MNRRLISRRRGCSGGWILAINCIFGWELSVLLVDIGLCIVICSLFYDRELG